PTPKDLAGLGRPPTSPGAPGHTPPGAPAGGPASAAGQQGATLRWSSDKGCVDRGAPGEPAEVATLPMLAQLTTAEQRWADREEDITAVSGDPFEVGQVFARRWIGRIGAKGQLQ